MASFRLDEAEVLSPECNVCRLEDGGRDPAERVVGQQ